MHNLDIEYTNAAHILKRIDKIDESDISKEIEDVIESFGEKSPSELELITTALFAHRHIENKDDENC